MLADGKGGVKAGEMAGRCLKMWWGEEIRARQWSDARQRDEGFWSQAAVNTKGSFCKQPVLLPMPEVVIKHAEGRMQRLQHTKLHT